MSFFHKIDRWPIFEWRDEKLTTKLADVRHIQGRLLGKMGSLGFDLREESYLYALTEEVVRSSEIEGERLDKDQVRSSIARHLGMEVAGMVASERNVEGVVEMMLDATQSYAEPLTAARLFDWHAALFPTGRSGMTRITVGGWRTDESGPMQVVSGPMGRELVHYEAPSAQRLPQEIEAFLDWFERDKKMDPVMAAGVAHLWFVSIHPFDDGNGRIARAVTDMALARSEKSPQRFYSMSSAVLAERTTYYEILERTQRGDMDITEWLSWFLDCLKRAFERADATLSTVLAKAAFWDLHRDTPLNDRQHLVLNRLLDGFVGNLTSSKWASLAKTSQDTASRDIDDLLKKGILTRGPSGGRSTTYNIILPKNRIAVP